MCRKGVWGPAAQWFGSAGVGRCRQCLEAGKLSVWKDYGPLALDSESTQSCRSERERGRGGKKDEEEKHRRKEMETASEQDIYCLAAAAFITAPERKSWKTTQGQG